MLSSPVDLIRVQRSGNKFYRTAAVEMQGWRLGHEDGHSMLSEAGRGSFWVLDGHGGDSCAKFCSPKLGEEFMKGTYPDDERIEEGFCVLDNSFHAYVQAGAGQESGSTVVGCIVQHQDDGTYCVKLVNCGDSRGLIVMGPDASEECAALEVRLPPHLAAMGSQN